MSVPLTQALGMTDPPMTTAARLARWTPLLFAVMAVSYFLTWWFKGNTTNLFFGIGIALVAQHGYFYPRPGLGSLRSNPGPARYKLLSDTLGTIGVVLALAAMVASWL